MLYATREDWEDWEDVWRQGVTLKQPKRDLLVRSTKRSDATVLRLC